jgi:hypothetical protein
MSARAELGSGDYPDVESFLEAVAAGPLRSENRETFDRFYERDGGAGASWYGAGCETGRAVLKVVREGWPEGARMVADLLDKTSAATAVPLDRRRRMIRTDQGDSLDMVAVYRGHLDRAWSRAVRRTSRGPQRVSILANMLCSGFESALVLAWRGAAAVAIADRLTAAGYQVRIVVGFGGRCKGEKVSCRITVKDHGGPLDEATAAAVAVPGFFRALGHAWTAAHHPDRIGSPGMSVQSCDLEADEIVLSHEIRDESSAVAAIDSAIERVNQGPDANAA